MGHGQQYSDYGFEWLVRAETIALENVVQRERSQGLHATELGSAMD